MLTDMDFDQVVQMSKAIVCLDSNVLNTLLSAKRTLITYQCESAFKNVLQMNSAELLAECVMETAGVDLKIDIVYKNFEEKMEELTGF